VTAKVAIVGATTWGTTLGILLGRNNVTVNLLARTEVEANELNSRRRHDRFLPDAPFPETLKVVSRAQEAMASATLVILAVPSHQLRSNIQSVRDYLSPGTIVLSATKGLERPGGERMSQVLEQELPKQLHAAICALSGPNLAREIIQGKPCSSVIASRNVENAEKAQSVLMSANFRVYTSDDVIGVELGGALKNIIALGAGFADGIEAGDNAKSAFITRGLAEITRLGVAAGAQPLTFAGLAGLGDLIATCSSPLSRNHYVGKQLALGRTWTEIRESMDNVAEGVNTTTAALEMAKRLGVEMPIAEVTYRVLFEGLPAQEAAGELMERPARSEW
jgi:glycerol-3-phosphate dehydrogenase (NAD(P)+)